MEEIIIEIDRDGNVKVEGKGIAGPDCVKLTEEIEEALGTVAKREMKPEYRQAKTVARKAAR